MAGKVMEGIKQAVNTTINTVKQILHPGGLVTAHNVDGVAAHGGRHHRTGKPETTTEAA